MSHARTNQLVTLGQRFSRSEDQRAEDPKEDNKYLGVSEQERLVMAVASKAKDNGSALRLDRGFCSDGFLGRSKQGSVHDELADR